MQSGEKQARKMRQAHDLGSYQEQSSRNSLRTRNGSPFRQRRVIRRNRGKNAAGRRGRHRTGRPQAPRKDGAIVAALRCRPRNAGDVRAGWLEGCSSEPSERPPIVLRLHVLTRYPLVIWNASSSHNMRARITMEESACGEYRCERSADRAVSAESAGASVPREASSSSSCRALAI